MVLIKFKETFIYCVLLCMTKYLSNTMKERVSATIDKETLNMIELLLKKGNYRNKSHVIEDAIKLLKEKNAKK